MNHSRLWVYPSYKSNHRLQHLKDRSQIVQVSASPIWIDRVAFSCTCMSSDLLFPLCTSNVNSTLGVRRCNASRGTVLSDDLLCLGQSGALHLHIYMTIFVKRFTRIKINSFAILASLIPFPFWWSSPQFNFCRLGFGQFWLPTLLGFVQLGTTSVTGFT